MAQEEMEQNARTLVDAVNRQLDLHGSSLYLQFEKISLEEDKSAYCRFRYMETNLHIDYDFNNWSTLSALAEWPEPRPLEWFGHIEMMAVQVMRLWEENYHLIEKQEEKKARYNELKEEVKLALDELGEENDDGSVV